jgi:uncharacterized membrane protein (UPF0127 family)
MLLDLKQKVNNWYSKMENGYIYLHDSIFPTLLAISEDEQAQGLMGKAWPPPIMSFIYAEPRYNRFWMKNTPSPLDIIFCQGGEIVEICKGEPNSTEIIGSGTSDLVIELPFGTVTSSNIKLRHKVGLVKPTTEELKKLIAQKYHGILKI